MATIENLQAKVQEAQQAGYNAGQISIFLKAKGIPDADIAAALKPNTAVQRVTDTIQRQGAQVESAIAGDDEFAGQSPVRRGAEATAAAANAVPAVVKAALPKPIGDALDGAGAALGKGFKSITDAIASIPGLAAFVTQHPKVAKVIEEVAGTAAPVGEIAGDVMGGEGAASTAAKAAELAGKAAGATGRATEGLVTRSSELVSPTPTPAEAAGEVLQGKTKDVQPGLDALGGKDGAGKPIVRTEGVKTYQELDGRIEDAIGALARQVDSHLAEDATPMTLDSLATKGKTAAGTEYSRNFVSTALDHLKELYATTGDDHGAAEIGELIDKAGSAGLTKLEVNDLSRLYGQEFGKKAFSKIGDPLTSVNAQLYENVRSGLKAVARSGIGGKAAKAADEAISSLYNTKRLVEQNVEAVQKLQQRIADRGLLEKAGHAVSKYADILSGGSIRGLIGGLLPRGAGYKVMNALDLEARLEKNLKIIREAATSGSDAKIISALKSLDPSSGL